MKSVPAAIAVLAFAVSPAFAQGSPTNPSVTAPSTQQKMTNPDGTQSPVSTAADVQLGPGTASGDMNGTSQSSANQTTGSGTGRTPEPSSNSATPEPHMQTRD